MESLVIFLKTRIFLSGRVAYPGGDMIIEKPVSGPNIRGRYARDLRGDKDVLYDFTNTNDMSHLGSDLGSMGHANAEGILKIKNKFLYQETLDWRQILIYPLEDQRPNLINLLNGLLEMVVMHNIGVR